MLVVIGIISTLTAVAVTVYKDAGDKARRAQCQELVHNAATALAQILQSEEGWPQKILSAAKGNQMMDAEVGAELARRNLLSLNYQLITNDQTGESTYKLVGVDQCGVVSPWASQVIRQRAGQSGAVSPSTKVPTGGTIEDHVLRFAIDRDFMGTVDVRREGAKAVKVRGSVAVWCCGADGIFGTKDDVQSWSKGQEVK